MNLRILTASFVGAIIMFVSGWIAFIVFLKDYFKASTIQGAMLVIDNPNLVSLFLADLAWSWLFAFVFDRWANKRNFIEGVKGGFLLIAPIIIGLDLQFMAFTKLFEGYVPMIIDAIVVTAMGSLTGGIIGFVLGRFEGDKAEL